MNEDDWDDILNKAVKFLVDKARAECGEGSAIADIQNKLAEFLYSPDQTIDMSGSRAQLKESMINYAKQVATQYI